MSYRAFSGCSALETVTIEEGVTTLYGYNSYGAFSGCTNLKSVHLPSTMRDIGNNTFWNCTSLQNISIPANVTRIGDNAFRNCQALPGITLPDTLTYLGDYAFNDCISLEGPIHIPSGVTQIKSYAFAGCAQLNNVTVSDQTTYIGNWAFSGCTSLSGITLSGGTYYIGYNAFEGCTELETVSISSAAPILGNTSASLNEYAFKDCTKLKSITIPGGTTAVSYRAFSGCSALKTVTIEEGVTTFYSYNSYGAFSNCYSLESVHLPSTMQNIGNFTFRNCFSLHEINIPANVTRIGDYAFQNCEAITGITLPDALTYLGEYAFYGCGNIRGMISIPAGVTQIRSWTFYGCSSLQNVEILGRVTSIPSYAFYGCSDLETIALPNSIRNIGNYAFYGCGTLQTVNLPEQFSEIGEYAFANCISLEDIVLGASIGYIGDYAFYNCLNLECDITISELMTEIRPRTFAGCTSLRKITITPNVENIGFEAFYGCNKIVIYGYTDSYAETYAIQNLMHFVYLDAPPEVVTGTMNGNINWKYTRKWSTLRISSTEVAAYMPDWTEETYMNVPWYEFKDDIVKIEFVNNICKIGDYTFYGYPALEHIEIDSEYMAVIGAHAFEECSSLNYIELKKWILTTIGDYSFHNCRSLQAFLIADSVNYVGEEAFTGTSSSFKAQCRWKSDLWTYVSNLGYDVEEAPYKISYSNLNPEMKHSLEYCIDHSTQGYYNKEMNYICAILAFSGYEKSTVRQNLRAMGFANSDIYQDYEYSSGDHVGYTIAYRQINDDEGIAVVVLRGSHGSFPFSPDWISNLANVGNGDRHAGFNAAANEVYAAMKNKIPMSDSHIKYVITGHSRGAAVGNLVEANIIRDYGAASRVYGYNYACPNTVTHGKYNSISCPNVFNFWNTNDIVPYVPASDTPVRTLDVKTSLEYMLTAAFTDQDEWKKYGKNLYFTRGVDLLAWATNIGQWDNNFWTELKQNFIDNHMKCYYQFATDVYYNGFVYRNQP